MIKNNKINIRLEVCRDKTSGKLTILAHFNEDAPNIFQEKGEYFWMPTLEEKELLNDAFELIPFDTPHITSYISTPKPKVKIELKSEPELEPDSVEEKFEEAKPMHKPDALSVFGKSSNDNKINDKKQDTKIPIDANPPKIEESIELDTLETLNEPESDELEQEKSKDSEEIIVEADSDAIEAALKKHTEKDNSFVEVNEKTIIDKVLSQKKKGKWSKN